MLGLSKVGYVNLTRSGKRVISILLAVIFLLTGFSCNNSDDSSCEGVCTLDFRTMELSIIYDTGEPVALDTFQVVIEGTGRDITGSYSTGELDWFRNNGIYPIIDDSYSDEFRNTTFTLKFSGYINNEEVVQAFVTAGADCCHVYLKDDDITITIPRG